MLLLHRMRFWATPVLLAALAVLLLAYSRKVGVLSLGWLKVNKDALAAINSLCSTVAVVVAGILAYYRFFRGRTLTTRAELSIDVDVIDGPESVRLHSVAVSVKNIGTVTIWDPQLFVYVAARHRDTRVSKSQIDQWPEFSDHQIGARPRVTAIDSGESADFSTECCFSEDVWVVTYTAILNCTTGDSWLKSRTIKGSETKGVFNEKCAEKGTGKLPDAEP
jgi:hypothetical protein